MQNQNQFSEMNPESLINLFEKINFFIKEYSKLYGLTEEMSNLLPFIEKLSKDIKGYENILELLNKDKEFSILCKKYDLHLSIVIAVNHMKSIQIY